MVDENRQLVRRESYSPYGDWSTGALVGRPAATVFQYAALASLGFVVLVYGIIRENDFFMVLGGFLFLAGLGTYVVAVRLALRYEPPARWGIEDYAWQPPVRPMIQTGARTLRVLPYEFTDGQAMRLANELAGNGWRWTRDVLARSRAFAGQNLNDNYAQICADFEGAGVIEKVGQGYVVREGRRDDIINLSPTLASQALNQSSTTTATVVVEPSRDEL